MNFYQTEGGLARIEVRMASETLWVRQNQMVEMFHTRKQNISQHLKAVYESGELQPAATVKKFLTLRQEGLRRVNRNFEHYKSGELGNSATVADFAAVRTEGVRSTTRDLEHYNLDAIISVGCGSTPSAALDASPHVPQRHEPGKAAGCGR